ncbi:hypothetical protein CLOM_g22747 [Closterium sp. NIES-68]|nr:hypothetical protein CLOM_g22747 [Closterium sp. NIES-68]GJP60560.1 hypothetical protein CLOP_g17801 [Closterium sp. NIES-67]
MAASLVMLSEQDGARRRTMEKAMRVMQLLHNDVPYNAEDSDPSDRIATAAIRRVPIDAQASPRQQQPSHRRGSSRVSLQHSAEFGYEITTPNLRASRTASDSSFSGSKSSPSPRLAASRSSSSASTRSPNSSDEPLTPVPPYHRPLDPPSQARRRPQIRLDAASTSALESLSSLRRSSSSSSSSGGSKQATSTGGFNKSQSLGSDTTSSVTPRTPRTPHGARHASLVSGSPALAPPQGVATSPRRPIPLGAAAGVPQSRRLRHHDTWHGESLDRAVIPKARADVPCLSHHLSPRELPRQKHHQSAAASREQRAEPAPCSHHPHHHHHHPSPRVSRGAIPSRGMCKSRSDPALMDLAESPNLPGGAPAGDIAAVESSPTDPSILRAAPQASRRPNGNPNGRIRRPAALVIDCDAADDGDDLSSPPKSARAPPTSAGSAAWNHKHSEVGSSPSLRPLNPHGATRDAGREPARTAADSSPRFPCAIPSPRLTHPVSPAANQRLPRQPASPSVGSTSAVQAARGRRRIGDDQPFSRRVSRFHTWDSEQLNDEPTPQIAVTPAPVPPSCPEPRRNGGFLGRRYAGIQSDGCRRQVNGGNYDDGGGAHTVSPHGYPPMMSHSQSIDLAHSLPLARSPTHSPSCSHAPQRFLAPSPSLPAPLPPRRSHQGGWGMPGGNEDMYGGEVRGAQGRGREEAAGAADTMWHLGQQEGGWDGVAEEAIWEDECEGPEVWAMMEWQKGVEEAEAELWLGGLAGQEETEETGDGPVIHHPHTQAHQQYGAPPPHIGDGPFGYQSAEAYPQHPILVRDCSDHGQPQAEATEGRDAQRSGRDAEAEGVKAAESRGSTKSGSSGVGSVVKPKSKLQRSLSDDDEEEDQPKDARPTRDEGSRQQQQRKKVLLQRSLSDDSDDHGGASGRKVGKKGRDMVEGKAKRGGERKELKGGAKGLVMRVGSKQDPEKGARGEGKPKKQRNKSFV